MKKIQRTLCSLSLVLFINLEICQGAPRKPLNTYDQRQDGKFNVHAKLDNFLIVIAPTSSAGSSELAGLLQNDLISEALDLKAAASRITGSNVNNNSNNEEDNNDNDKNDERINNDRLIKKTRQQNSESSITRIISEELPQNSQKNEKKIQIVAIVEKNLPVDLETSEQLSEPSSEEKNTQQDASIDLQTQNANFSEGKLKKEGRNLKNSSDELKIKKIAEPDNEFVVLEENKVPAIGNDRGNDFEEREPQELKLIGGGIENCGPERFRDRFGICRFRVKS